MSIHSHWHDDARTILLLHADAAWTWDDLFAEMDTIISRIDEAGHLVDLILDFTETLHIPDRPIVQLPRLAEYRHPNLCALVFVGIKTPLARITTDIFGRLYKDLHRTATMEEALAVVARRRAE